MILGPHVFALLVSTCRQGGVGNTITTPPVYDLSFSRLRRHRLRRYARCARYLAIYANDGTQITVTLFYPKMPRSAFSRMLTRTGVRGKVARFVRGRYNPGSRKRRAVAPKTSARKRLRTATATKHQRARPLPNRSGSESKYNVFRKPKGLIAKVANKLQDNTYQLNTPSVIAQTAGLQATAQVGTMFSHADLLACIANVQADAPSSGTGNGTTKVYFKSCYSEVMLQNTTNAVVRVQLWNTLPKRDIYQDPSAATLTPVQAWTEGLKIQTSGSVGNEIQYVGSRPTDAKLFNDYYRVGKVTYLDLAPGQVHYHRMHYKIDRFIALEMLNAANLYTLRGWALGTMIVAYGEPMADVAGTSTTTAPVRIHAIATANYHFSYIKSNSSYSTNANNLPASANTNLENLVTGASAAFATVA